MDNKFALNVGMLSTKDSLVMMPWIINICKLKKIIKFMTVPIAKLPYSKEAVVIIWPVMPVDINFAGYAKENTHPIIMLYSIFLDVFVTE